MSAGRDVIEVAPVEPTTTAPGSEGDGGTSAAAVPTISPTNQDPAPSASLEGGAGSALEIVTEPSSLVVVESQCAAVEAAAEACESVPTIKDWSNKLAGIDEYLSRTSKDGRARVAAAMRRLEERIGVLLGPPPTPQESGARKGSLANEASDGLTPNERSQFRAMAADPDTVEEVIAGSTDADPPSRRKVFNAVDDARTRRIFDALKANPTGTNGAIGKAAGATPAQVEAVRTGRKPEPKPKSANKPKRSPLPEQADRAGWEFRKAVERLERIYADDRFAVNREQVAAVLRGHLTYATEVLPDLLRGLDTEPQEAR